MKVKLRYIILIYFILYYVDIECIKEMILFKHDKYFSFRRASVFLLVHTVSTAKSKLDDNKDNFSGPECDDEKVVEAPAEGNGKVLQEMKATVSNC